MHWSDIVFLINFLLRDSLLKHTAYDVVQTSFQGSGWSGFMVLEQFCQLVNMGDQLNQFKPAKGSKPG